MVAPEAWGGGAFSLGWNWRYSQDHREKRDTLYVLLSLLVILRIDGLKRVLFGSRFRVCCYRVL